MQRGALRSRRHSDGAVQLHPSLAEDALAQGLAAPLQGVAQQQVLARKYWERYATPLLFAWLHDFADAPTSLVDADDREKLIDWLVVQERDRPAEGKERQELQKVWKRIWRPRPREIAPLWHLPAVAPLAAAVAAPSPDVAELQPANGGASPAAARALAAHSFSLHAEAEGDDDQKSAAGEEEEETPPPAAKRKRVEEGPSAPSARAVHAVCRTCLHPAPVDDRGCPAPAWVCTNCAVRGDLPAHADAQQHLAALARSKAQAALSSGSSAGQSQTDTRTASAADTGLSRLDKDFERQASAGAAFPLFEEDGATNPELVDYAFRTVRLALGASATQQPSEQLKKLIQVGKLMDVGQALPRALLYVRSGAAAADNTVGSFDFTEGGGITAFSKYSLDPPPLTSSDAFCNAMFSTIIPALAGRPRAQAHWCGLARTALEISRLYGWTAAADYLHQLLVERVPERRGFAEPSHSCLTTVQNAHGARVQQQQRGADRPSGGGAAGVGTGTGVQLCHDFNGAKCTRGPACRFAHKCSLCGGAHAALACTKPAGSRGTRGGSGKSSAGKTGGSVNTNKPAAPAASTA